MDFEKVMQGMERAHSAMFPKLDDCPILGLGEDYVPEILWATMCPLTERTPLRGLPPGTIAVYRTESEAREELSVFGGTSVREITLQECVDAIRRRVGHGSVILCDPVCKPIKTLATV